jgi:hypothetical protein
MIKGFKNTKILDYKILKCQKTQLWKLCCINTDNEEKGSKSVQSWTITLMDVFIMMQVINLSKVPNEFNKSA